MGAAGDPCEKTDQRLLGLGRNGEARELGAPHDHQLPTELAHVAAIAGPLERVQSLRCHGFSRNSVVFRLRGA